MVRTEFLLKYIADVELRKTIQAATNKSEEFNQFIKWLFFGNQGIIAENVRHEQRKVVKYNQLVANLGILHGADPAPRLRPRRGRTESAGPAAGQHRHQHHLIPLITTPQGTDIMTATTTLHTPLQLGAIALPNRIVMAPLTRMRSGDDGVPTAMNAAYYAQRASAASASRIRRCPASTRLSRSTAGAR